MIKHSKNSIKRKALSDVVTTTVLVLITLAGALVLAQFVIPFVKEQLRSGSECIDINRGYFTFEEKIGGSRYNCKVTVAVNDFKYGFSIKAASAAPEVAQKVSGFQVVFSGSGTSLLAKVPIPTGGTTVNVNARSAPQAATANDIPSPGEITTFWISDASLYKMMQVYPITTTGKVCDATDYIEITDCGSPTILT